MTGRPPRRCPREPGDRRTPHHQPLSRVKEATMCPRPALRALALVSLLSSFAFASDLKIRVLDPQSARVAGAQVSIYRPSDSSVLVVLTTDARGESSLPSIPRGDYKVQVLASGFSPGHASVSVPGENVATIKLAIA